MFKFNKFIGNAICIRSCKKFSQVGQKKKLLNIPVTKILENYRNLFEKSEILEEMLPRQFKSEQELYEFFNLSRVSPMIKSKDQITLASINKAVNEPMWDLIDRGGKRWRPILGLMIAKYLNMNIHDYSKNKLLYSILGSTELLHNATLMIDDVTDKSEFRRNKPCSYKIFGKLYNLSLFR